MVGHERIQEKCSLGKTWIYLLSSIDCKKHFLPGGGLGNTISFIKNVCTSASLPEFLSASN